jgi:hypothetical protein
MRFPFHRCGCCGNIGRTTKTKLKGFNPMELCYGCLEVAYNRGQIELRSGVLYESYGDYRKALKKAAQETTR